MLLLRVNHPSEPIVFVGHEAECQHCGGVVKMFRDLHTRKLEPHNCRCLGCAQPYHVDVGPDIDAWELTQWEQKARRA